MLSSHDIAQSIESQSASKDLRTEQLNNGRLQMDLYYYQSICDLKKISNCISEPFARCETEQDFMGIIHSQLLCTKLEKPEQILPSLLSGHALIWFEGQLYALSVKNVVNGTPSKSSIETTVQGPQIALSEDLIVNINLVRLRYPSATLIAEERTVGRLSQTKLSLLYDKQLVKDSVLKEIQQRLQAIEVDIVQAVGQLEVLLSPKKLRLFPYMLLTERPDRIALNLSQGKVVILMQGTPFAIIAPAIFYDFMSAMDDLYQSFWISKALVFLRYVALVITIILPASYIAIVSYNPEIFRVQFALSIAGSRAAVPYPSFVEVMIMLFLIEALVEASIRLPRYIGSTATTVGGLILGQAAQQAGLVSSIMIIITSVVAISNFVIPINAMSFALRFVKYPLILLATFFGIVGIITGFFCFLMYLSQMTSFGEPYFRLFIGETSTSGYKEERNR